MKLNEARTSFISVSMMTSNQCIAKLTRALKEKLPSTLEKILIESSFDTETSILGIDSDIIAEIESFVNDNKHILENTEYDCVVKSNTNFKFKPGHRSVLKLLPKSLKDYNNSKKKKKYSQKKTKNH